MVQHYDGYNHEDNEEQKKKEDYIQSLLGEVIKSYPKQGSKFKENLVYSKLVNKYAEETTDYLDLIKKDVIKKLGTSDWLNEDLWNVKMEYSDEFEEEKRKFYDCLLFQDCLMYLSHPSAALGFKNETYKVGIQVKVVTCKDTYKKFLLPLSKEIYNFQTGRLQPRELSGLGTIDYYVWIYWSQTEHKSKGMFILRNLESLFVPIIAGSGIVELMKDYYDDEGKAKKTVLYLNPNHIAFPTHEFLTDEPPLLH